MVGIQGQARTYLQLLLRQRGAGNVYLLVKVDTFTVHKSLYMLYTQVYSMFMI